MKASTKKTESLARKQARRDAQRRSQLRSRALKVFGVLAGIAGVIALIVFLTSNQQAGAGGPIEGLQTFSNLDRSHTNDRVTYEQTPPVGGSHNPAWQNCGVYTEPIASENAVHSLEHGAVWITYQPDLAEDELQKLEDLTRKSGFRLLSPFPGLSSPIVLSAWGYQLQVEQADDPRIADFIRAYEQNPQGPEPGAPCTGGVGQPG